LANGTNGGLANNYQLADTTHSATIDKKALTITGTTAADKTYDGNTTAAITQGTLSGFVGSETVTSSVVGNFDSRNAGSRTATAAYTLANGTNGGLADNYQLANTTHSATIAVRELNVKGITAENKVYNGNTEAKLVLTAASLENTIPGDDIAVVTTAAKGSFLDANVKNDKKVLVAGLSLSGVEANNYRIATHDDMFANITPQPSGAVAALTSPQNAINGTSDRPVAGGNPIMPSAGTVATVSPDRNALIVDNTVKVAAVIPVVSGAAPVATNSAALLRIPTQGSMVLSSDTGNRSISLTAAGNVTTLSLTGGNPNSTTPTITTPALPVFKGSTPASVSSDAAVVVSDQGSNLSATKAAMSETGMTASAALDSANKSGTSLPSTRATISMADGSAASMSVAVTAEGVLVVRMPAGASQDGNESAVTLLAIAAAKANLSITPDALRGVLILPSQ
jgi:hypothetical protein